MNETASQKQKSSIPLFAGAAVALVCIILIILRIQDYRTGVLLYQYTDAYEYFQIQYIAGEVFTLIIYVSFMVCAFMLYASKSSKAVRYAIVLLVALNSFIGTIGTVSDAVYQYLRFGLPYRSYLPSILLNVIVDVIIIIIVALSVTGIIKSHIPMLTLVIILTLISVISLINIGFLLNNILINLLGVLYYLALYLIVLSVTVSKVKKVAFTPPSLPYQGANYPVNAGYRPQNQSYKPAYPSAPPATQGPYYGSANNPVPVPSQPVAGPFNGAQAPQPRQDSMNTIRQLAEMHSQGILTDEEFEAKKKELLERI